MEQVQAFRPKETHFTIEEWAKTRGETLKILTENESVWLACAIDAEGSIYSKGRYPQVLVYNTSRAFVERAVKIAAAGNIYIHNPSNHPKGWRGQTASFLPIYTWRLATIALTVNILRQIEPELIIKKDKAQRIINQFKDGFTRLQGLRCGKCGVGLKEPEEGGWPRRCVHCNAVNDLMRVR